MSVIENDQLLETLYEEFREEGFSEEEAEKLAYERFWEISADI